MRSWNAARSSIVVWCATQPSPHRTEERQIGSQTMQSQRTDGGLGVELVAILRHGLQLRSQRVQLLRKGTTAK